MLCVALIVAGCSKSSLFEISGHVLVDGKPLTEGAIELFPVDKKGPLTGGSISDGFYKIRAAPGPKIVRIQAFRKSGEQDMGGGVVLPLKEQTLPARYNSQSELKLEVTQAQTQYDFRLFSADP